MCKQYAPIWNRHDLNALFTAELAENAEEHSLGRLPPKALSHNTDKDC
jgi:hypothetical protein